MLRKYALILGGNSKLGQHLVSEFRKKSISSRWKTLSMDYKKNFDATENLIFEKGMTPQQKAKEAFKKAKEFAEEFDAIIVANSDGDFEESKISDDDIFEKYQKYWDTNVYNSIIAARIGSNLLAPCGIMVLHSSIEAFEETNARNLAVNLSRVQTCAVACNLGELKEVPPNCIITTILPKHLDSQANIEGNHPGFTAETLDNSEQIARMIKTWSAGEARPENNSFVSFERASKKITFPKFV
mmetsp:Transcript_23745/g.21108  ORF Transcript_23745/g.21108 Transcript_23745/m.21108 type:complete len:242 (+) Transcript_23745:15-740(+)